MLAKSGLPLGLPLLLRRHGHDWACHARVRDPNEIRQIDKDIDLSEVRFYRDPDGKCALDLRGDVGTLTDTEGRGGVETRPGAAARKLVLEGSYDLP